MLEICHKFQTYKNTEKRSDKKKTVTYTHGFISLLKKQKNYKQI